MLDYVLIRYPLIRRDLDEIHEFVSAYAGPNSGYSKVEQIVDIVNSLAHFPHIGTVRNEVYPDLRAFAIARKGVICFTVDDVLQTVFVICVTYCRRRLAGARQDPYLSKVTPASSACILPWPGP